ncbi:MAG: hypothetical protein ACFFCW_45280 [Candidatus Hodarchaeota archaeon]
MTRRLAFLSTIFCMLLVVVCAIPVQGEEGSVKALAAWQGKGELFKIGEKQGLFVGRFGGIMFIEKGEEDLDAANFICPANMEVNLENGFQAAQGRCTITGRTGDQVFAEFHCKGVHLKGCKGQFKLTGGTGKFKGITGESDFLVRAALVDQKVEIATSSVHETALGLAVWPELRYKIP